LHRLIASVFLDLSQLLLPVVISCPLSFSPVLVTLLIQSILATGLLARGPLVLSGSLWARFLLRLRFGFAPWPFRLSRKSARLLTSFGPSRLALGVAARLLARVVPLLV